MLCFCQSLFSALPHWFYWIFKAVYKSKSSSYMILLQTQHTKCINNEETWNSFKAELVKLSNVSPTELVFMFLLGFIHIFEQFYCSEWKICTTHYMLTSEYTFTDHTLWHLPVISGVAPENGIFFKLKLHGHKLYSGVRMYNILFLFSSWHAN